MRLFWRYRTPGVEPGLNHHATGAQAGQFSVVTVDTLADLSRHAAGWNRLSEMSRDQIARHTYPFVRAYINHWLPKSSRWLCLFVYCRQQMVGVAPLIVHAAQGDIPVWSSGKGAPPINVSALTILAEPHLEVAVMDTVLADVRKHFPRCNRLHFSCIHEESVPWRLHDRSFASYASFADRAASGGYIPIEGTYADYYAGLGSKSRKNLRKFARRLASVHQITYQTLSGSEVTDEHIAEFLRVEASGWKGREGTAILCNQSQVEFYWDMLRNFREVGWLRLGLLQADGKLAAGYLGMQIGSTLILWKICYDEALADCGPGNLLFEQVIEHAFADGHIREINCLSVADWQRHWHMRQHEYYNLYFYPLHVRNVFASVAPMMARQWAHRIPGSAQVVKALRSVSSTRKKPEVPQADLRPTPLGQE